MMMSAEIIQIGIKHGMEAATDLQFRGMYEELTEPELEALNRLLAFARAIEDEVVADMNEKKNISVTKVCNALVAVERNEIVKLCESFGSWALVADLVEAIRARGNRPTEVVRPWVGLTREEMVEAVRPLCSADDMAKWLVEVSEDEYQAIEAALKEKNR